MLLQLLFACATHLTVGFVLPDGRDGSQSEAMSLLQWSSNMTDVVTGNGDIESIALFDAEQAIKNVQKHGRKDFSSCVDSFGDGVVVTAFMDSFYMGIAEAWAVQMKSFGYVNNAIFALDAEAEAHLRDKFKGSGTCVISYVAPTSDRVHNEKLPPLVGLAKFDAMEVLVKKDRVGIITEADVYWFRDPAPYLHKEKAPIVGAITLANDASDGLNIGFVRVLPHDNARRFLTNMTNTWYSQLVGHLHTKGGATLEDQNLFNDMLLLEDKKLWHHLDPQEFQLHDRLGFHQLDCQKTVVAHLTFMEKETKIKWLAQLYRKGSSCEDLKKLDYSASSLTYTNMVQESGKEAFRTCFNNFRDNTVVATFMDSEMVEFAKPWAKRLSSMGYDNLAVFAFDDESVSTLRQAFHGLRHACVVPYVLDGEPDVKIPSLVSLAKLDAMEMIIRHGKVGIITEADVFWMKSPLQYLRAEKAPLVGLGRPQEIFPSGPDGLDMGFMRVRPDKHLLSFLEVVNRQWLADLEKDAASGEKLKDVDLFNTELQKTFGQDHLLWGRLDPEVFALHEWKGWPLKSCESLAIAHLTEFNRRDRISKLRKMYSGTLTCEKFEMVSDSATLVTQA